MRSIPHCRMARTFIAFKLARVMGYASARKQCNLAETDPQAYCNCHFSSSFLYLSPFPAVELQIFLRTPSPIEDASLLFTYLEEDAESHCHTLRNCLPIHFKSPPRDLNKKHERIPKSHFQCPRKFIGCLGPKDAGATKTNNGVRSINKFAMSFSRTATMAGLATEVL